MKKMILNTLLIALTVTVSAQTSRRQGGRSEDTRNENKVKSTARISTQSSNHNTPARTENRVQRESNNRNDNRVKSTARISIQSSNHNTPTRTENRVQRESNNRNDNYDRNRTQSNNHKVVTTREVPSRERDNYRGTKSNPSVNSQRHPNSNTYKAYHKTPRTNVRYIREYPSRHVYVNRNLYVRRPPRVNVVWDVHLHRDYCTIYPHVKTWNISYGMPIYSVPAYETSLYVGEIKRVYGYVSEVYYDRNTDYYHLYIGGMYPYQDFTAIVPGYLARQISHRPYRYFTGSYISTTGLVSHFNGQPEMVVKKMHQIRMY